MKTRIYAAPAVKGIMQCTAMIQRYHKIQWSLFDMDPVLPAIIRITRHLSLQQSGAVFWCHLRTACGGSGLINRLKPWSRVSQSSLAWSRPPRELLNRRVLWSTGPGDEWSFTPRAHLYACDLDQPAAYPVSILVLVRQLMEINASRHYCVSSCAVLRRRASH